MPPRRGSRRPVSMTPGPGPVEIDPREHLSRTEPSTTASSQTETLSSTLADQDPNLSVPMPSGHLSRALSPLPAPPPSRHRHPSIRSIPSHYGLSEAGGSGSDVSSTRRGRARPRVRGSTGTTGGDNNERGSTRSTVRAGRGGREEEEGEGDDEDEDEEDELDEGFDEGPTGPQMSGPSDADSERSGGRFLASRTGGSEGMLVPLGQSFRVQKKRTRVLPTAHQSSELYKLLAETPFPTTARREELGRRIGLSARKVQVWFQNQRQKARRQQSETVSRADFLHQSSLHPTESYSEHQPPQPPLVLHEVEQSPTSPRKDYSAPAIHGANARSPGSPAFIADTFNRSLPVHPRSHPSPGPGYNDQPRNSTMFESHYSLTSRPVHHEAPQHVGEGYVTRAGSSSASLFGHPTPLTASTSTHRVPWSPSRPDVRLPPLQALDKEGQSGNLRSLAPMSTLLEQNLPSHFLEGPSTSYLRRVSYVSEPSLAAERVMWQDDPLQRRGSDTITPGHGRDRARSPGAGSLQPAELLQAYPPPFIMQPRPLWTSGLHSPPAADLSSLHSGSASASPLAPPAAGPGSSTSTYPPSHIRLPSLQHNQTLRASRDTRREPPARPNAYDHSATSFTFGDHLSPGGTPGGGEMAESPFEEEPSHDNQAQTRSARYDPVRDG